MRFQFAITNGSPLFSGNTTSGESQIRRSMLERDLIEAIIALPSQLFYNTDIGIYAFILSKNKGGLLPYARRSGGFSAGCL